LPEYTISRKSLDRKIICQNLLCWNIYLTELTFARTIIWSKFMSPERFVYSLQISH